MSAIAIGSRALRPARLSVIRGTRGHAAAVEPPSAPFLPPSPATASTQEGLSAAQASLRNVPARPSATARDGEVRRDWTRGEIQAIYDGGLMETIFRAVSRAELFFVRAAVSFISPHCAILLPPTGSSTAVFPSSLDLLTPGLGASYAPRPLAYPTLHPDEHQKSVPPNSDEPCWEMADS